MKSVLMFLAVMMVLCGAVRAQWIPQNSEPLGFGSTPLQKSLVVDSTGNAHVVFRLGVNVMYFERLHGSGQWTGGEAVTDSATTGQIGEVAIAWNPATEQPVFAFQSHQRIWFATKDEAGNWIRQMMGDPNEDAYSPDIAVNSVGTIYVVYVTDDTGYQLDYGYFNGATWEFNDIDTDIGDFGLGAAPRIAVDEDDAAHVVFRGGNFGGYNAKHATNEAGGSNDWVVTTLNVPHAESYPGDVAVDHLGRVHCMSSGSDGFGMPGPVYHHMRDETGDWLLGMAASPIDAVEPSLALDGDGTPHAMWSEISGNIYTGFLYYSTQNDNWLPHLVYDNSEGGSAFVIGSDNYGHLLYANAGGQVLYLKSDAPLHGGGGGEPELTMTPTTLDFDSVEVGQDSTMLVRLENTGDATLTLQDFVVVGGGFVGPPWIIVNLAPGAFMNAGVEFRPAAEQNYLAYALAWSTAASSPDTLYLTGRGYRESSDAPDTPLPLAFALLPLYPNPFNGAVNVSFTLPRASEVSLKVFDVLGREVTAIVNETKQAGLHSAQWSCAECAAGVYLFKLEVAGQSFVQKAAFVK